MPSAEDTPDTRESIAGWDREEDDGIVETGRVMYASNSALADSHRNVVASPRSHPRARREKWRNGRKRV